MALVALLQRGLFTTSEIFTGFASASVIRMFSSVDGAGKNVFSVAAYRSDIT